MAQQMMMFINELKLVKKMIGNGFVRWFGLLNSFPIHPKFLSKMVLVFYGIRICHHFLLCSNHISWIYRESWTESESRKVACFKRISRILLLVVIYNSVITITHYAFKHLCAFSAFVVRVCAALWHYQNDWLCKFINTVPSKTLRHPSVCYVGEVLLLLDG